MNRISWCTIRTFLLIATLTLVACGGGGGGGGSSSGSGSGAGSSSTVGAAGGTVVLQGGAVKLAVPAGALAGDATFTATSVSAPPSLAGSAWDISITPPGTTLAQPAKLTLQFVNANVPPGTDVFGLTVAHQVNGAWQPLPTAVDPIEGTATVEVTSFSPYGIIPAPAVAAIGVAPGAVTVGICKSAKLTATATDADGNALDAQILTWSSSAANVATVAGGVVTGRALGSASVTASAGAVTSNAVTVTVDANGGGSAVSEVSVTPRGATIRVDDSIAFFAQVNDCNGLPYTGPVTWASSNPGVATLSFDGVVDPVTGTAKAVAKGIDVGTTLITATADGITSEPAALHVVKMLLPGVSSIDAFGYLVGTVRTVISSRSVAPLPLNDFTTVLDADVVLVASPNSLDYVVSRGTVRAQLTHRYGDSNDICTAQFPVTDFAVAPGDGAIHVGPGVLPDGSSSGKYIYWGDGKTLGNKGYNEHCSGGTGRDVGALFSLSDWAWLNIPDNMFFTTPRFLSLSDSYTTDTSIAGVTKASTTWQWNFTHTLIEPLP